MVQMPPLCPQVALNPYKACSGSNVVVSHTSGLEEESLEQSHVRQERGFVGPEHGSAPYILCLFLGPGDLPWPPHQGGRMRGEGGREVILTI